ncbi:MAG: iron-containing redox enzyme family protein [Gammaproteobacteria bacterium]|nr:iron-containing redox enzyme family protein [Gammaproteobacteria bacterium]
MPFYNQLLTQTQAERETFRKIPTLQAGVNGQLSIATYVQFLTQAYHHVKHTVPLLMAFGSRLPGSMEWMRTATISYIEEETGHHEWILNDIRACGGDADAVRNGQPNMATEIMVAYAYDTIARRNPLGFLGMVHVLEGSSKELASEAARQLGRSLQLPDSAFTYLITHGELDISHDEMYQNLVNKLTSDTDKEAIIHATKLFFHLYGNIFRSLEQPLEQQTGE